MSKKHCSGLHKLSRLSHLLTFKWSLQHCWMNWSFLSMKNVYKQPQLLSKIWQIIFQTIAHLHTFITDITTFLLTLMLLLSINDTYAYKENVNCVFTPSLFRYFFLLNFIKLTLSSYLLIRVIFIKSVKETTHQVIYTFPYVFLRCNRIRRLSFN